MQGCGSGSIASVTAGKYRSDIDGLRAIAVLAVVAYHAHFPASPGGFVGVDVFFVISGYLITSLILQDIEAGRFSIASFYERRVRRIMPALFLVLLAMSVAAYVLLVPYDMEKFGKSLLATILFSSNFLFWQEAGYFDASAEQKPLLHTWSLSVEEQFYLFFPLFLWIIVRVFRTRYRWVIAAMLLGSLALSVWRTEMSPIASFYLAPTRAWELLTGALLAAGALPAPRRTMPAAMMGVAGLALIGYGILFFSTTTPFPGASALYPVLGTALVITSGSATESVVARAMSAPPLVFVGLISYSLYLWHWVLLFLAKYYAIRRLQPWETVAVVCASGVVATLSWRFVERPFRGRSGIWTRRGVFAGTGAASALLCAFGATAILFHGLSGRYPAHLQRLMLGREDIWSRRAECIRRVCHVGDPAAQETFVVWGDSHVGALAPAVDDVARQAGVGGLLAFRAGCPPLLHLKTFSPNVIDCEAFNDSVLATIERRGISRVVFHARWAMYAEGNLYGLESAMPTLLAASRNPADNYAVFERRLRETLAELQRRHLTVVIVASVPEVGLDVPSVIARAERSGLSFRIAPTRAEFLMRQARAFSLLQGIASADGVTVIYPHEVLCDASACAISKDGKALYSDASHLTTFGARTLEPQLAPLMDYRPAKVTF